MNPKKYLIISAAISGLFFAGFTSSALAGSNDCPVGLVSGMSLDEEFGPGAGDITRCVENRKKVKVVYQVNTLCKNSACTAPYALGNIINAIKDYEITSGMVRGEDYEIVAVVHSGGTPLVLNNYAAEPNNISNPFQETMEKLLNMGVKVYYCQNTARKKGVMASQLIPGVQFVTAGVSAIADFQLSGYAYIQP